MGRASPQSLVVACAATLLLFCLPVADVHGKTASRAVRYGIIIDAGSSGSRIYVYRWPAEARENSLRVITLKTDENGKLVSRKTTPGLSSFRRSPEKAFTSLVPLLKLAASHIPVDLHPVTNIYVLATAGMRLLKRTESTAIMSAVYNGIRQKYAFNVRQDHVKVISGQMEGVFGWIAVNYVLNRFSRVSEGGKQTETYGFIEMGGASEQIAYEAPDQDLPHHLGHAVNLCFPRGSICLSYHLYVTTFLGFGANSALTSYFKLLTSAATPRLATSSQTRKVVSDPCQPRGMRVDLKASAADLKILSVGEDKEASDANIQVTGTGQFAACRRNLAPLLHLQGKKPTSSLSGTYQPPLPLSHKFYGFSEFWYCMEDILGIGGHYSYQQYVDKNQKFCGTDWSSLKTMAELEKKFPKADHDRLRRQCFKAAWLAAVLHDGHHFPENYDLFQSVNEINHTEVQWTLGALVYLLHPPLVPDQATAHSTTLRTRLQVNFRESISFRLLGLFVIVLIYVSVRQVGRRKCPSYSPC